MVKHFILLNFFGMQELITFYILPVPLVSSWPEYSELTVGPLSRATCPPMFLIYAQYRRFDSNGKALFLIVRTVEMDSSYSI